MKPLSQDLPEPVAAPEARVGKSGEGARSALEQLVLQEQQRRQGATGGDRTPPGDAGRD